PFRPGRLNHPRPASERFLYAPGPSSPFADGHLRPPESAIPVSHSSPTITSPDGRTRPAGNQTDPLSGLFPLPMGPYERYMLIDDTAAYPMTFLMAVEVSGDLQREAFESAVQGALDRHPLCRCRVERYRGKGWCWTPVPAAAPQILWEESAIP